jgi:HD domain
VSGGAEWAARYAEGLSGPLGARWALHTAGVADQARRVARVVDEAEQDVLIASAYLHDIGYAPALAATGCHALDGSWRLRELGHERLAGLVAYHSGSRFELNVGACRRSWPSSPTRTRR